MKDIIRSYRIYAVWEYQRELEDLNNMSANGLQLVHGGCFHSLFKRNDQVRYIYQLDYQPSIEDRSLYIEMFAANDWEYVNSTWNGWHYFRKPYREDMTEDERNIYTDRSSLQEMQKRYTRVLAIISFIYCLLGFVYLYQGFKENSATLCIESITFLLLAGCMTLGLRANKAQLEGKYQRTLLPIQVVFPTTLVLLFLSFLFLFF